MVINRKIYICKFEHKSRSSKERTREEVHHDLMDWRLMRGTRTIP